MLAKFVQLLAWSDWLACELAHFSWVLCTQTSEPARRLDWLKFSAVRAAEAYFASWKQQLTLETMFPVWQTEKHWGNMHTPWINIFGISRTSVPGSRVTLTVCKRRLSWTLSVETLLAWKQGQKSSALHSWNCFTSLSNFRSISVDDNTANARLVTLSNWLIDWLIDWLIE